MTPRSVSHGIGSVVLATIVSGCAAVGPNYARPQLPAPAQHRFAGGAPAAEAVATMPWWQVFDDPALQVLVKEAIASNLDLRVAAARVEEARANAGIARSFLYPQIDGDASYGGRGASDAPNGASQNGQYGFRLSWEIDLFGRLRREREAAVALALASEQGRRGVMVSLVSDVAQNYFLLRELDLQLEISRQTLQVNDDTVTYFRNRLEGGVSNRLELDRITANRAQTAAAVPEIENRIALVEHTISLLLGRPPGPVARERLRPETPLPPPVPAGLPAALLERRPDVLAAEQLLVSANADIGAARALFFPRIDLTGFGGAVHGDVASLDGGVWSLSAGLLQPIFNGGRLRRNQEAAQARFDAALAEYHRAALNSYREVANALITIQKLADVRRERQQGVTALQDASELARARYESGLASYIEILTADEQLFQEQLLLAQTHGEELRARADLYRALGGGWEQDPAASAPAAPPSQP